MAFMENIKDPEGLLNVFKEFKMSQKDGPYIIVTLHGL